MPISPPAVTSQEKLIEMKAKLAEGNVGLTGHAVTLIGYDDTKTFVNVDGVTRQGAFLAVNSWGRDWGVSVPEVGTRGFIWLAYDFASQGSFTSEFFINRPEETPKALAIVEWEHPLSHQIHLELLAGPPQASEWRLNFPHNLYNRPVKTRIALDITEAWEQGSRDFWLRSYTCDFALGDTRQIWGDFDGDGQPEGVLYGNTMRDNVFCVSDLPDAVGQLGRPENERFRIARAGILHGVG
ncbi:hypothetical protein HQ520_09495 [bacterium]|nr:hypothetical protein [bacterium]